MSADNYPTQYEFHNAFCKGWTDAAGSRAMMARYAMNDWLNDEYAFGYKAGLQDRRAAFDASAKTKGVTVSEIHAA
jgi:hypothetical protein